MQKLSKTDLLFKIDYPIDMTGSSENNKYTIIGQDRAVMGITMGVEMESKGYNIFVAGCSGTGRRTTTELILENYKEKNKPLTDIVLVCNYQSLNNPIALFLNEGDGIIFKDAIKSLIEEARVILKRELGSKAYKKERDVLLKEIETYERDVLSNFEKRLEAVDFAIVKKDSEESSADLLPIYKGETINFDKLQELISNGELAENVWLEKRGLYYTYMDEMKEIFEELRLRGKNLEQNLNSLNQKIIKPSLKQAIDRLKERFNLDDVKNYLDNTFNDILDNIFLFNNDDGEDSDDDETSNDKINLSRYLINVLIDNTNQTTRPIIKENNPTWTNLFGIIENKADSVSFMDIRAGSLLKASGGFLILKAEDILAGDEIWSFFKKVMLNQELIIQAEPSPLSMPIALKAEKLTFNTKIILIGSEQVFDLLYNHDSDFRKLFKIIAEFNETMPLNADTTNELVRFCQNVIYKEKLLPIDEGGLRTILFYATKLSEYQNRYSSYLSGIADFIRESSYHATKLNLATITSQAVLKAINVRNYLNGLTEEIIHREITEKFLLINIVGKKVGKINALVVIDRGNYSFGCPALITAQATAGKDGLINIEKEVGLSGEIHDKGVMILEGFLRSRFARHKCLSLTMSLCFEQNYDGVEGDSATLAECCALISSIANATLRQDIALTGSMNQFGEIQPVGGVSDKITGFYKICKNFGLTGSQGVIFPKRNLHNLFLDDEILDAVDKGIFHVWAIDKIEEALELLTNMPCGKRDDSGIFNKDSLFYKIETELTKMNSDNNDDDD